MSAFPNVGLRISVEGLPSNNDKIRGIPLGYQNAMHTLEFVSELGCKDIGVSMTIHDGNYEDALPFYHICKEKGYQFATGVTHNSFFFETSTNEIQKKIPSKHKLRANKLKTVIEIVVCLVMLQVK